MLEIGKRDIKDNGLAFESSCNQTVEPRTGQGVFHFWFKEVLSEFFEPYRKFFKICSASDGFLSILDLLDREGHCSSVVNSDRFSEGYPLQVFEALKGVTLRDHSVNVSRQMFKLLKNKYLDYENLIPKAFIVSFGHDLGKIPSLELANRSEVADHSELGARKVGQFFSSEGSHLWVSSLLEVIRNHHRLVDDSLTLLLQKADTLARQEEALAGMSGFRSAKWDDWFDPSGFFKFLFPHINEVQYPGKWEAFSFGSYVYFSPYSLYDWARGYSLERKVLEMSLWRVLERDEVLHKIVGSLRRVGFISDQLPDGAIGRNYEVRMSIVRSVRLFLTPVKIGSFGVLPHKLEKKKMGKLSLIRSVKPSYSGYSTEDSFSSEGW
ncbi:MAG: HD domain-containing protein [Thermodesulfobacteriota bacterium]